MKNKMQSKKEYYVDEILKLAFLLKQEYAKDERERAEYRSKFRVVVPFTPSYIAGKEDAATENKKPSETAKTENNVFYEPLKFTDKEISKMPKTFRKEFRVDGCTARIRKRCDGRYNCSYEIRYRRNGYNLSVSAPTLEEAKEKFIKKLQTASADVQATSNRIPTTFNEFALFWFENFYKRKVAVNTYQENLKLFKRHLYDRFSNTPLKKIDGKQLQDLIDEYVKAGKSRTAESIHGLLNQIFKTAVKFGLIVHSPADIVVREAHTREHGSALTLDEEKLLLSAYEGTPYQLYFAVALYTGMRPNEYETAEIHGDMIVARNSKRKHGKIAYKRIPIIKMLKPYLQGVETIEWVPTDRMRSRLSAILPNHTLKDLRTTFYTHCVTCGVAESARDEMVGHDSGILKETYTDLSDEFLYQEAQKLVW